MKFFFILIFAAIFIASCDGGLAPIDSELENQTGFGGTITFIGDWSPDITQTNIVLFKYPILSEADFNISNLKYLSTSIPFDFKEYSYNTIDSISFGNVVADKYSYLVEEDSTCKRATRAPEEPGGLQWCEESLAKRT